MAKNTKKNRLEKTTQIEEKPVVSEVSLSEEKASDSTQNIELEANIKTFQLIQDFVTVTKSNEDWQSSLDKIEQHFYKLYNQFMEQTNAPSNTLEKITPHYLQLFGMLHSCLDITIDTPHLSDFYLTDETAFDIDDNNIVIHCTLANFIIKTGIFLLTQYPRLKSNQQIAEIRKNINFAILHYCKACMIYGERTSSEKSNVLTYYQLASNNITEHLFRLNIMIPYIYEVVFKLKIKLAAILIEIGNEEYINSIPCLRSCKTLLPHIRPEVLREEQSKYHLLVTMAKQRLKEKYNAALEFFFNNTNEVILQVFEHINEILSLFLEFSSLDESFSEYEFYCSHMFLNKIHDVILKITENTSDEDIFNEINTSKYMLLLDGIINLGWDFVKVCLIGENDEILKNIFSNIRYAVYCKVKINLALAERCDGSEEMIASYYRKSAEVIDSYFDELKKSDLTSEELEEVNQNSTYKDRDLDEAQKMIFLDRKYPLVQDYQRAEENFLRLSLNLDIGYTEIIKISKKMEESLLDCMKYLPLEEAIERHALCLTTLKNYTQNPNLPHSAENSFKDTNIFTHTILNQLIINMGWFLIKERMPDYKGLKTILIQSKLSIIYHAQITLICGERYNRNTDRPNDIRSCYANSINEIVTFKKILNNLNIELFNLDNDQKDKLSLEINNNKFLNKLLIKLYLKVAHLEAEQQSYDLACHYLNECQELQKENPEDEASHNEITRLFKFIKKKQSSEKINHSYNSFLQNLEDHINQENFIGCLKILKNLNNTLLEFIDKKEFDLTYLVYQRLGSLIEEYISKKFSNLNNIHQDEIHSITSDEAHFIFDFIEKYIDSGFIILHKNQDKKTHQPNKTPYESVFSKLRLMLVYYVQINMAFSENLTENKNYNKNIINRIESYLTKKAEIFSEISKVSNKNPEIIRILSQTYTKLIEKYIEENDKENATKYLKEYKNSHNLPEFEKSSFETLKNAVNNIILHKAVKKHRQTNKKNISIGESKSESIIAELPQDSETHEIALKSTDLNTEPEYSDNITRSQDEEVSQPDELKPKKRIRKKNEEKKKNRQLIKENRLSFFNPQDPNENSDSPQEKSLSGEESFSLQAIESKQTSEIEDLPFAEYQSRSEPPLGLEKASISNIIDILRSILTRYPCYAFIYGSFHYKTSPNDIDLLLLNADADMVMHLINELRLQTSITYQSKIHEILNFHKIKITCNNEIIDITYSSSKEMNDHFRDMDFSIGAAYYYIIEEKTIYPNPRTLEDIHNKILYSAHDIPLTDLVIQDPTRIFRIIRILVEAEFPLPQADREAIKRLFLTENLFSQLRPSKLNNEIKKLFFQGHAERTIDILVQFNLINELFALMKHYTSQEYKYTICLFKIAARYIDHHPNETVAYSLFYYIAHWILIKNAYPYLCRSNPDIRIWESDNLPDHNLTADQLNRNFLHILERNLSSLNQSNLDREALTDAVYEDISSTGVTYQTEITDYPIPHGAETLNPLDFQRAKNNVFVEYTQVVNKVKIAYYMPRKHLENLLQELLRSQSYCFQGTAPVFWNPLPPPVSSTYPIHPEHHFKKVNGNT